MWSVILDHSFSTNTYEIILFVPGITKNLLSVSKFTKDNKVLFKFSPTQCYVRDLKTNKVLFRGSMQIGLYKLHLDSTVDLVTLTTHCLIAASLVPLPVWHFRPGYPCITVLKKALQSCNIPFSNKGSVDCVACHLIKDHKLPFSSYETQYTPPLQLVAADVRGPTPVCSNGLSYYVVFIDAYTRYTWVYFLKRKFDVATIFQQFHV